MAGHVTDERRRPRLLGRPAAFLHERDPGLLIVHRALRVTIAASSGFFLCRYLVGDVNTGVYALFATVALGALSEVTGTPAQRTRTYLGALVVGLALASVGTILAVSTWAAAAGMLVVGFLVSFAARRRPPGRRRRQRPAAVLRAAVLPALHARYCSATASSA